MKMWACATSTVFCQGNDGAGTDMIAFGDEGLGEVAIADGEVAVTEGANFALRVPSISVLRYR